MLHCVLCDETHWTHADQISRLSEESQQPNVPADEMAAGALTEALIGCAVDANSSIALKGTALATLLELVEAVLGSAPAPVGDELAVRAVAIVSGIVAQMPESEADRAGVRVTTVVVLRVMMLMVSCVVAYISIPPACDLSGLDWTTLHVA